MKAIHEENNIGSDNSSFITSDLKYKEPFELLVILLYRKIK
jgi:hypothetical protein